MTDQIFADGLMNISVLEGAVRIDFFKHSPTERDKDGKPARVFSHRLVMTLQGFLQTAGAMDQLVSQMEQRGLVTRRAGGTAEATTGGLSDAGR